MKTRTEIANALEAKRLEAKGKIDAVKDADIEAVKAAMAEVEPLLDEIKALEDDLELAQRFQNVANDNDAALKGMAKVERTVALPTGKAAKTLGELVTDSDAFKAFKNGAETAKVTVDVDVKTVFTSTAGMAPQITRTGDMVETINYPLTVVDSLPVVPATQSTVRIQQETLTATAAEIAETGEYPEGAISWADVDFPVRKVGVILPISDEELEDIPGIQALINGRLVFDVNSRLNGQIINGLGTGSLLKGILATANIGAYTTGTGSLNATGSKAIFKAKQKLAVDGACTPTHVIMNPNDWAAVVTETATSSGVYLNTAAVVTDPVNRIWGMTVILSDRVAAGTLILFDATYLQLRPLRGVDVQIGYNGTDFGNGKKSIRADVRVAFVVRRPQAIAKVTSFTA